VQAWRLPRASAPGETEASPKVVAFMAINT
jgi:hypothetical protein